MPTVTGTLSDIGLAALAAFSPVLQFTPSEPAASPEGRLFAGKPVEVVPNSAGAFSANLASTDGIVPRRAHWVLSIGYRNPDGYMSGGGYFTKEFPTWPIRVPAAGGQLVDMLGVQASVDMVYVGPTPPPADRGYTFWIDISGATPVLNREQ
jgi:hypothetical protein